MLGYIYKTTNTVNGHFYIGKKYGEFDHTYYGSGVILKQALAKYGKESFIIEVLRYCDTEEDINAQEIRHIAEYQPWYNIAIGGTGGNTLALVTDERKQEVSIKRINGIKRAHAQRTPEEKQRIAATISAAKVGKASARPGYEHTEETRKKISASLKGHPSLNSPERLDKIKAKAAERRGIPNHACYKPVVVNGVLYDSVKGAAEALGVCRLTLYNKTKKGEWTIEYT